MARGTDAARFLEAKKKVVAAQRGRGWHPQTTSSSSLKEEAGLAIVRNAKIRPVLASEKGPLSVGNHALSVAVDLRLDFFLLGPVIDEIRKFLSCARRIEHAKDDLYFDSRLLPGQPGVDQFLHSVVFPIAQAGKLMKTSLKALPTARDRRALIGTPDGFGGLEANASGTL